MENEGDMLGTLLWGLRRFFLLVVVCVIALGAFVPWVVSQKPVQYDAQAQVGPVGALQLNNLDSLPRLGDTVFNNGAVATAIRESTVPPLPGSRPVIPNLAELITAQDNPVFVIVGHGSAPESAKRVADAAAARFATELNKYSKAVGSFAVQRFAVAPASPVTPEMGRLPVLIGAVSGLVVGVGLVALLLVIRRPVVTAPVAARATGVPVIARLSGLGRKDVRGLARLCRSLRSHEARVIYLTGTPRTTRTREVLVRNLSRALGPVRPVVWVNGSDAIADPLLHERISPYAEEEGPALVVVNEPSPAQLVARSDSSLLLMVVPEGVREGALRAQSEWLLDGGDAAVVLMGRLHRSWRMGKRSRSRERMAHATHVDVSSGAMTLRSAVVPAQPGPAQLGRTS